MSVLTPEAQINAITGFKAAMLAGAQTPGVTHVTNRSFIVQPPQSFDIQACALGLAAITFWGLPTAMEHGCLDVFNAYHLNAIALRVPLPLDLNGQSHTRTVRTLGDALIHLNDCCTWTVEAIAGYLDATVAAIRSQIA